MELQKSLWKYVGGGEYNNMTHRVISHDAALDEIITYCIQSSWLGGIEQFTKDFRRVQ